MQKLNRLNTLLLLPLMTGWVSEVSTSEEVTASSPPITPARGWNYLTRVEATTLALVSRTGVGDDEVFIQVEPTLIIDGGPEFGINVGAPVRFRMWGGGSDAGLLRHEDWDSLSDWGQVIRGLKFGSDNTPMGVWFGPLEEHRLLSGHLVRRYSNRTHPDYHPAGGIFTGTLGPIYAEAFVSDVLGARLMGAELSLDLEHVLFGLPEQQGRYTLGMSAVHDWGQAGGRAPSVTLAHLDATAGVLLRPDHEVHLIAGWGGRPGQGGAWGAVLGAGIDVLTEKLHLRLRLEARRQHGGFRQGFFGADYELARFQATALAAFHSRRRPFRRATPRLERRKWGGMRSVTEGSTNT